MGKLHLHGGKLLQFRRRQEIGADDQIEAIPFQREAGEDDIVTEAFQAKFHCQQEIAAQVEQDFRSKIGDIEFHRCPASPPRRVD
ncbi:hypothetical protein [Dongia sp.]|uniref:hypothetical protein n=1 Tax=Dongia sp. TaxID=1977262 RepID=UPI0035B1E247